jgi:tetrahydromethanopterin S-methyltransferase subunit A
MSPEVVRGNPDSPVAVCTLSSHALLEQIAHSPNAELVAMLGPLETENLGIERMLTTLLRAPRIRWLVVCGDESRGRYQGQALAALYEHGIRPDGTIPDARSRRARVRALTPEQVDVARRQVRLHDMRGINDLAEITRAIRACLADDPGPFDEQVTLTESAPIDVPARPFRLQEHDPAGFFVILVDRAGRRLLVEHYTADGVLAHRIQGPDTESLCGALLEWGLISRLDHAAYMGRELAKAEAALVAGLPYRQDEPLGSA